MLQLTRCVKCSPKFKSLASRPLSIKFDLTEEEIRRGYIGSVKKSPYEFGHHRSNAQQLISKVPVIEVDGYGAVCDGGGGALGHPVEYIQLNTVSKAPQVCKYCGLRYIHKTKSHH